MAMEEEEFGLCCDVHPGRNSTEEGRSRRRRIGYCDYVPFLDPLCDQTICTGLSLERGFGKKPKNNILRPLMHGLPIILNRRRLSLQENLKIFPGENL